MPDHPHVQEAVELVARWPVPHAAVAVLVDGEVAATHGDLEARFRLASVSKLLTAWAVLVAVEEATITLDEPAGQPGCTVRHLLAHAGGYGFDGGEPAALPGRRRIYSNTGFEVLADHLAARSGLPFTTYLAEAVLGPLGMASTDTEGSPAKGFVGPLADLVRFVGEIFHPTLLAAATAVEAVTCQFPLLAGLVPGVGRFDPCPWGLGPELRGAKSPHWTGTANSAETFGHFGGAGTFVWVDPVARTAVVALTDREFGNWALTTWPTFSDAILSAVTADRIHGSRPT